MSDDELLAELREPSFDSGVCYDFPDGAYDYQDVRLLLARAADRIEQLGAGVATHNTVNREQIEKLHTVDGLLGLIRYRGEQLSNQELDECIGIVRAVLALLVPTPKETSND